MYKILIDMTRSWKHVSPHWNNATSSYPFSIYKIPVDIINLNHILYICIYICACAHGILCNKFIQSEMICLCSKHIKPQVLLSRRKIIAHHEIIDNFNQTFI